VNGTIATRTDVRWNGTGLNAADKKLYSPGDGDLEWMTNDGAGQHGFAVSHQGTKRVYLNTSGNSYFNGGNLGIGTTGPASIFHVRSGSSRVLIDSINNGTSFDPGIEFRNYDSQSPLGAGIYAKDSANYGSHLYFSTKADGYPGTGALTERMRITQAGTVCINTTTSIPSRLNINGDAGVNGVIQVVSTNTGDKNVDAMCCKPHNDTYNIINFTNTSGVYRASINGVNSTTVSYVTSSDSRMKTNVIDMPSIIDRIKQLRPCNFVWKDSGDKGDGFIAQEVFKVFPQLRNGVLGYCNVCSHTYNELYDGNLCDCCDFENPIDKDGKPRYYGLDYGKFTPYLTKALQETIAIVESQAARIATLEAQVALLIRNTNTTDV
jgi:hypothetical protein